MERESEKPTAHGQHLRQKYTHVCFIHVDIWWVSIEETKLGWAKKWAEKGT